MKTALVIVDVQKFYKKTASLIQPVLQFSRHLKPDHIISVVHHTAEELAGVSFAKENYPLFENPAEDNPYPQTLMQRQRIVFDELTPEQRKASSHFVFKYEINSFDDTGLGTLLKNLGVKRTVTVGAYAYFPDYITFRPRTGCASQTAQSAANEGFESMLVADLTLTRYRYSNGLSQVSLLSETSGYLQMLRGEWDMKHVRVVDSYDVLRAKGSVLFLPSPNKKVQHHDFAKVAAR